MGDSSDSSDDEAHNGQDGADSNLPRYYAQPQEQMILIMGLKQYFSLPERSRNRNRYVKSISEYLMRFSPHWTHRAVRLWFNNNRHTYFQQEHPSPPQPSPPPISSPRVNPPISPTTPKKQPPITLPPLQAPQPVHPPPPPQAPQESKPIIVTFPQLATSDLPYDPLKSLLSKIYSMAPSDPSLPPMISEFDSLCSQIISKSGTCRTDKLEDVAKFVHFPQTSDQAAGDFSFADLPDSPSVVQLSEKGRALYDPSTESFSVDQFSPQNIWQTRRFSETRLPFFNCAALGNDDILMAHPTVTGNAQLIDVAKYREGGAKYRQFSINVRTPIESIYASEEEAWALTDFTIYRLSFGSDDLKKSTLKEGKSRGLISMTAIRGGLIVANTESSTLFVLNKSMEAAELSTSYSGVRCISSISDGIICGATKCFAPRLISLNGREVRAFVGHCNEVLLIRTLSENLFSSFSDDGSVRVWDVRQQRPSANVFATRMSVSDMTGCSKYLICSFHNGTIGAVDLRAPKAVLGVQTQDYVAETVRYRESDDSFAMIGLAGREPIKESTMFMNDDGESRKRILRLYPNFLETKNV